MAHQTGSPALPNGLFHRLERAVLKLNPAHSATLCEPRTCLGSLDWRNILTPAARSAAACRQATNGRHTRFYAKLCAGIEKMVYLCITQAALGKLKASFLSSRLHCLCRTQAALGKLKASFLSSRLHRLCKRSNNTTTKRHTRNETPHHLSSGRNGHGTGIMQ